MKKEYKGLVIFDFAGTLSVQDQLLPELQPIVKELSKDHLIAIVSSSSEFTIRTVLQDYALLDCVASIVGYERAERKGSSIKKLCKFFNINSQKTVFIGDQMSDMEEGDYAGVSNIFVTWGFGKFIKDTSYNMIGVAHSPNEISTIINTYITT